MLLMLTKIMIVNGELMKWTKFRDELPKCDWYWVLYNDNKIRLRESNIDEDCAVIAYYRQEDYSWMGTNIQTPPLPEKPRHQCTNGAYLFECFEHRPGKLWIRSVYSPFSTTNNLNLTAPVNYCPICGFKPDKND